MAGDKQTIEQFSIDLLLNSPQFLKNLQNLEQKVAQAAQRIERSFSGAFNLKGKGAKNFQSELNRVVKNTQSASKQINQSLTNAFNTRGSGNNFTQWVKQAQRASAEVEAAVGRANRRMGGSGRPPAGGGSGSGAPRQTSEERLQRQYQNRIARQADSVHAQMFGSTMDRLRRGGHTEQANQFRNQIRDSYVRNRGNADPSVFRREIREIVSGQRSFLNSQRSAAAGLDRAGSAADGLSGRFAGLAAGVLSVQAALEFFKASIQTGIARTQGHAMAMAAYNNDPKVVEAMTARSDQIADAYGMDKSETRKAMAAFRSTMPKSFSNEQLSDLFENENVFAHNTGMSNDQVFRLNYAMQQIAASPRLMGQDFMQLTNASPALVAKLVEMTGSKDSRELREKAKSMSGADFVQLMSKAMTPTVAQKLYAQNNMQTDIGKYRNATQDLQEEFFNGFSSGFRNLLSTMVVLFQHSGGTIKTTGEMLGGIFNDVAQMVTGLTNSFIHARGYTLQFLDVMYEGFSSLPKKGQDALGDIGDLAVKGTIGFIAYKVFTNIFKMFGLIRNVAAAATTTAEVATVAVSRMGMLTGFLKAFRLGPLAEFLLLVELAGNASAMINSANTLRGKMGLDPTRGFSERAHDKDANFLDKLLGYNPDELFTWFKGGISDSPIMNGNWTGATAPNGITPYVPNVSPLLTQQQGMKGEVTVKVEGANGQIIGQATLNQNNRYQAAIRGSMSDPWSDASPNVPLTRPVQQ